MTTFAPGDDAEWRVITISWVVSITIAVSGVAVTIAVVRITIPVAVG